MTLRTEVPRVGDRITTAEQLDALPHGAVVLDRNEEAWQRTSDGSGEPWESPWYAYARKSAELADEETASHVTVLHVPGEQPQRAATVECDAEERLSELLCDLTGGRLSKPTYPVQVMARAIEEYFEEVYAAETATATVEDAQVEAFKRAWHEADTEGDKGNRVRRGLAAAGLLAHPLPGRDALVEAVGHDGEWCGRSGSDPKPDGSCCDAGRIATNVLALLS